jgi:hypothetical protein
MSRFRFTALTFSLVLGATSAAWAQTDTTSEDDFSQYANVGFADKGSKRFCSPKIEGLSPAKLISIGYDYQAPYTVNAGALASSIAGNDLFSAESAQVRSTDGLRLACNIPVVSKTNLVWQMGANYWNTQYRYAENSDNLVNPVNQSLAQFGLRTAGVNTTLFKPLNQKEFILFQGSADLSGTYNLNLQPARFLKYSAAVIYGRRPSEKKQWGVGVARTYRVGELNYIPVVLYNATDARNKWGVEMLFPARAHVRYTINPRNLLFAGFELEGQSYRLWNNPVSASSAQMDLRGEELEIRRGEIRARLVYECSLKNFVWMSLQAGYRVNYRYDVDRLVDGAEIYRAFGILRDDPYAVTNSLGNPFYVNLSFNLVSP